MTIHLARRRQLVKRPVALAIRTASFFGHRLLIVRRQEGPRWLRPYRRDGGKCMLSDLFLLLACRSGQHRRRWFGPLFEQIARRTGHIESWTFMNYGYARKGLPETCHLDPDEEAERYCAQRYHRAVDGIALDAKDVVKVTS